MLSKTDVFANGVQRLGIVPGYGDHADAGLVGLLGLRRL